MINKKDSIRTDASSIESFIGPNTFIKGDIKFTGDKIKIDGSVEGRIDSKKSSVIIGQEGSVHATIFAKELIVAGSVEGDIVIEDLIDLHAGGSIDGHVKSKKIKVEEGAVLDGIIEIGYKSKEEKTE